MNKKIILAYSGGLDSSVILKWLINKGYTITCYVADVGQKDVFDKIKETALAIGAKKVIVDDLKQEFVEDYIFESLKTGALYEGRYLLGTAVARPLIVKKMVAATKNEGATIIAHGCTGKGNDQVRFEIACKQLMPEVEIIAPWRDPEFLAQFQGRDDLIAYAKQEKIPTIFSTKAKPYSMDSNLMHTSYEGGDLEDPSHPARDEMFLNVVSPLDAPDVATKISITFKKGIPIKVINLGDGTVVDEPLLLFQYLNKLGAENGIGRLDIVESRFIGIKSRGVYETPGGTILHNAHHDLETLILDKEVLHLKAQLSPKVAKLIYNGLWLSPEMAFLMSAMHQSQEKMDGTVEMMLYKGNATPIARSSVNALYNSTLASMEESASFNQQDATGFINIHSLRLRRN